MLTDILDAILEITPFPKSDLGRHLVCNLTSHMLPKSVKKPFVSIFWGFNLRLTRLYLVLFVCARTCKADESNTQCIFLLQRKIVRIGYGANLKDHTDVFFRI